MRRVLSFCGALCLIAAHGVVGKPMTVKVDMGQAHVWSQQTSEWTTVTDSAALALGDSVSVDHGSNDATVLVGREVKLLFNGMGKIALNGTEQGITVGLVKGQVLLQRTKPYELNFFNVIAGECVFIPVGTAAAVKFTKAGEPSVAVLRGKMRAEAPGAMAVVVERGNFCTYTAAKSFKQGALPPQAITALQKQYGVDLETTGDAVEVAAADTTAPGSDEAEESTEEQQAGDTTAMEVEEEVVGESPEEETETVTASADEPAIASPASEEPVIEQESAQEESEETDQTDKKPAKEEKKSTSRDGQAKVASAPPPGPAKEKAKQEEEPKEEPKEKGGEGGEGGKPSYELSAGAVTVDGEQWTRVAFGIDVPIWRFGLFFDIELFIDADGQFSNKGWDFDREDWAKSLARKIRYVRFNHENDPLFVKFGGLESVTLGYGFVVDRFTNMLDYPDEKLLGLQFYLNDISPVGITLQTMVADFLDFRERGSRDLRGGVVAGRLAVRPLKMTEIPILSKVSIGGLYASDLDQYAEGRKWESEFVEGFDKDGDKVVDYDRFTENISGSNAAMDSILESADDLVRYGALDTHYVNPEIEMADTTQNRFSVLGFDVGIPIISTKLVGLDVYGQMGISIDDESNDPHDTVDATGSWGIGAPGVQLRAGPLLARLEYRRTQGYFEPGYFGPYYFEERLTRHPVVPKEALLDSATLNGLFGTLGFDIAGFVNVTGTYQRMVGQDPVTEVWIAAIDTVSYTIEPLDQRFEATAGVGQKLLERIPKITKAEAFFYKTQMQQTIMKYDPNTGLPAVDASGEPYFDKFFERSPNTYWGYRLGAEVLPGSMIMWETRYGWAFDNNWKLVEDNNVSISAGIMF